VSVAQEVILVAIYTLCFVAPLLAIVLTLMVAGERAEQILTRARDFLQEHWPVVLAILALVAGLFVTALGVTGLISGVHGRVGRVSRSLRRVISR
jgi:hypothetical protein